MIAGSTSTTVRTILHPTDFSEASRKALEYAVSLARGPGSRLVILHVVDTLGPEQLSHGEILSGPQPETYHQRLWNDFQGQIQLPVLPEPVELVLGAGEPEDVIVGIAAEKKCDLIVMADHDHEGLQGWLFRSVTEHVIRQATCSVLIVKEATTRPGADLEKNTGQQLSSLSRKIGPVRPSADDCPEQC
jgi:universal stress protein A